MKTRPRVRQLWETFFKHPKLFPQDVILSDGGVMPTYSLSPMNKIVRLAIDSGIHPSWNAALSEYQASLGKHGRIMQFNSRFGDLSETANECEQISIPSAQKTSYENSPVMEEESQDEPAEPDLMKFKRAAAEAAAKTTSSSTAQKSPVARKKK